MAKLDWTKIKHFKKHEFKEPDKVSPELVYKLDHTREMAGVPIIITGSYRAPQSRVPRDTAHKPNGKGKYEGVDIKAVNPRSRYRIMVAAIEAGFTRIGVYNAHLHLDVATKGFSQRVMWWGRSK